MPRSSAAIIALPATSVDITGEAALRASEVRRDVVPIPVRLISERYSADMVILARIALRGIDRAAAKYQRRLKADVALHQAGPVAKVTGGPLRQRTHMETRWRKPALLPKRTKRDGTRMSLLVEVLRSAEQSAHINGRSIRKERVMIICNSRTLAVALLIAALPAGFALAAGRGGAGGLGGGVGAGGIGSAAVGGGAPAGAVGGGASRVGGGSPGSSNPAGNGSAGTGNPSTNASGVAGNAINASPGVTNATTTGGVIGGYGGATGVAPAPDKGGGVSPAAFNQEGASAANPIVPEALKGTAEEQMGRSTTGLSQPGPDGLSTVTVGARPCGVAAHETDGTTTCIGIPTRSRR
jgi:hypothetical protein